MISKAVIMNNILQKLKLPVIEFVYETYKLNFR